MAKETKRPAVRGIPARMKLLEHRQRRLKRRVGLYARDTADEIDDLDRRLTALEEEKRHTDGLHLRVAQLEAEMRSRAITSRPKRHANSNGED